MVNIFNDITQHVIPINWMNQSDFSRHPNLTHNLKSWLYETALLTTRLKQSAKNFQLKVLKETYEEPSPLLSDVPITDNNYIREIMMLSDDEPCILGQTTVPEDTLKHNGWAKKLGTKGLGEALVNPRPKKPASAIFFVKYPNEVQVCARPTDKLAIPFFLASFKTSGRPFENAGCANPSSAST